MFRVLGMSCFGPQRNTRNSPHSRWLSDGTALTRFCLYIPVLASFWFATMLTTTSAYGQELNPSTLTGKLIFGYQGWFECPGDNPQHIWIHWFSGSQPTVDMLPDVTELPLSERCNTGLQAVDGRPIAVYSAESQAVVERHFEWMRQYGLDGIALQRFGTTLSDPVFHAELDRVLSNVRAAAEANGRVFFLEYDLSGLSSSNLNIVSQDWRQLEQSGLTRSPAYLQHRGHPVLGLYGLGFNGRPITPEAALDLLHTLQADSAAFGGVTLMGGVPGGWRTRDGDASPDPAWDEVYRTFAVLSPWTVGRYTDLASADRWREQRLEPDMVVLRRLGIDYMPVVFPGFSWHNLQAARGVSAPLNQIPRRCGTFYWRQVQNAVAAGATTIFGAMFDEVDEGTAMFKLVAKPGDAPPNFLTLDADGCELPSDWYLRLAGAATAVLRGNKDLLSTTLPLPLPGRLNP